MKPIFYAIPLGILLLIFIFSANQKVKKTTITNVPQFQQQLQVPFVGDVTVQDPFNILCLNQKGVVNMDFQTFNLSCREFDTGKVLNIPSIFPLSNPTTNEMYLKQVYPLATCFFPNYIDELYFLYNGAQVSRNNLIYTAGIGSLYQQPSKAVKFFNTNYVEVSIESSTYSNLVADEWVGCWYDMVKGSGFFIPVKASMMAYNSLHCLTLFKISPQNILQYSSGAFKQQLITLGKTIEDAMKESSTNFTFNYLNNELGPKRYLASMAAQKGYKSIQLSDEFDGKFSRQFFVDLIDPNLSTLNLIRMDPFSLKVNPVKAHWYLNLFNEAQIPNNEILYADVSNQYNEFPFKEQCRVAGGTISIKDVYLYCLKILRFGLPTQILFEQYTDYSAYAKNTQLEKLQSYFTVVYGNPNIWREKTQSELQDRFDHCEIYYEIPLKALNLAKTPKGQRVKDIYYDVGNEWYNPNVTYLLFANRPAELLNYIEVFRQNERFSLIENPKFFGGFYYVPARGSGYFLPTGKIMVGAHKESAYIATGQPVNVNTDFSTDAALARQLMYKSYDTFITVNFEGMKQEILDVKDPISSQMSLIRSHPFSSIVNEPSNNVFLNDPYFSQSTTPPDALNPNCTINRQFDGRVDSTCLY